MASVKREATDIALKSRGKNKRSRTVPASKLTTTAAPKSAPVLKDTKKMLSSVSNVPVMMGHLSVKRFADTDNLTPGAIRSRANLPHECVVDYAPTARCACKMCGKVIPKKELRFSLSVQCHKGYKMAATLHRDCFLRHPESRKIEAREEVFIAKNVRAHPKDLSFVLSAVDSAIAEAAIKNESAERVVKKEAGRTLKCET
eukprot:CFRG4835T1